MMFPTPCIPHEELKCMWQPVSHSQAYHPPEAERSYRPNMQMGEVRPATWEEGLAAGNLEGPRLDGELTAETQRRQSWPIPGGHCERCRNIVC